MKFIPTAIPEVILIEPTLQEDSRGYFAEVFRQDVFTQYLEMNPFVQENLSFSKKNVFRGLHFQQAPYAQAKLVQCLSGQIIDIAVDIRPNSPTYKKSIQVLLSGQNHRQLFIPRGFAHGFFTIEEALIRYKVDNYYHKQSEQVIYPFDDDLHIDFGKTVSEVILSEKDANGTLLKDLHKL